MSVSFNQIVALSPPAPFGATATSIDVPVTVKNITSGVVSNAVLFTYTPDMHITAIANGTQSTDQPFTPVTIFGQGSQAPVASRWPASRPSCSRSRPRRWSCCRALRPAAAEAGSGADRRHEHQHRRDGDLACRRDVHLRRRADDRSSRWSRRPGSPAATVEIDGSNLPDLDGQRAGPVRRARGDGQRGLRDGAHGHRPPGTVTAAPTCTGTNPAGTLQTVETVAVSVNEPPERLPRDGTAAFAYQLPCVVPAPP